MYELDRVRVARQAFSLRVDGYRLERGSTYAVVGPNGSGKTTFLDLLALLQSPLGGQVVFAGERVDYRDAPRLLGLRRRIAYLMQNPYLFSMSVSDNIAYGLEVRGVNGDRVRDRVRWIEQRLSLEHLAGRNAHRLSGGEAQRVALARALVLDPDVYLLDEPTANVDRHHVRRVEELIHEVSCEREACVVMTTHSQDQAYRMSRNLISIIDGRIADVAYENVFTGVLEEEADGLKTVVLPEGPRLKVSHGRAGPVTVAIDPEDIIVSTDELESSALNRFPGKIAKVEGLDGSLRVYVDVGALLCVMVTARSFRLLGLNVGKQVWTTFKATAIHVLD